MKEFVIQRTRIHNVRWCFPNIPGKLYPQNLNNMGEVTLGLFYVMCFLFGSKDFSDRLNKAYKMVPPVDMTIRMMEIS